MRLELMRGNLNGLAELFVDTFNRALIELKGEGRTVGALETFLMPYRSAPCPSGPGHLSPTENFLRRRLRIIST